MRLSHVTRVEEQYPQLHQPLLQVLRQTKYRRLLPLLLLLPPPTSPRVEPRHPDQRDPGDVPLLRRRNVGRRVDQFRRVRGATLLPGWVRAGVRPDHRGPPPPDDTGRLPGRVVLQEATQKQQEEVDQRADERARRRVEKERGDRQRGGHLGHAGRQPDNDGRAGRETVQGDGVPRDRGEGRAVDHGIVTRSLERLDNDDQASSRATVGAVRRFDPFSRLRAVNPRRITIPTIYAPIHPFSRLRRADYSLSLQTTSPRKFSTRQPSSTRVPALTKKQNGRSRISLSGFQFNPPSTSQFVSFHSHIKNEHRLSIQPPSFPFLFLSVFFPPGRVHLCRTSR